MRPSRKKNSTRKDVPAPSRAETSGHCHDKERQRGFDARLHTYVMSLASTHRRAHTGKAQWHRPLSSHPHQGQVGHGRAWSGNVHGGLRVCRLSSFFGPFLKKGAGGSLSISLSRSIEIGLYLVLVSSAFFPAPTPSKSGAPHHTC